MFSTTSIGVNIETKVIPIDIDENKYSFVYTYMFDEAKFDEWYKDNPFEPMMLTAHGIVLTVVKKKGTLEIQFSILKEDGSELLLPLRIREVTFVAQRDDDVKDDWIIQLKPSLTEEMEMSTAE